MPEELQQELATLRAKLEAIEADRAAQKLQLLPRPGYDGEPPKPTDRIVEMRVFASNAEKNLNARAMVEDWTHISPRSTLVCVVGNHYKPTCWQKIIDMVKFTNDQGIRCGFSELQDRCFNPYDALGTMRNEAILKAVNEGFEYICYLDADVKPDPDMLTKLLSHRHSVIAPYVVEQGTGRRLHGPSIDPDTGVRPVKWCVLSMLLIKTAVFNAFGNPANFWADAVGADEGFHFQKLWYVGHRPWIDTAVQLVVDERPHYPLATLRFTHEEYQRYWNSSQESRKKPPDRRPIDPNDKRLAEGEYNPFVEVPTNITIGTTPTTTLPGASSAVSVPINGQAASGWSNAAEVKS